MLPFLELTRDGEEHTAAELREPLANRFELTEKERLQKLPSGVNKTFNNRVAWAKIHLEKAGFIENVRRGVFRITDVGRRVLADAPGKINLAFLDQFEGHMEFRGQSNQRCSERESDDAETETPQESLESAYEQLREDLAGELLQHVRRASPSFFEQLVVDLLLRMGYGGATDESGAVTNPGADEGIDGVINQDALGLEVIYLQAKRWQQPVGRPEIHKFVGALHGQRARKGVFITTSSFTRDAEDYAKAIDPKIVLIDGKQLAELMMDYDVGVSTVQTFALKKVDIDYFLEE